MAWTLDYIEDAATARRVIRRPNGTIFTDRASNYETPYSGVHLCGVTDDGEQPTTVASYPMSARLARVLFDAARVVSECGSGEHDFIVDLCIDDEIGEDFHSNRQLWPRAIDAWNALPDAKRIEDQVPL